MKKHRAVVIGAVAAILAAAYLVYRVHHARAPYEWSGMVEARTMDIGSRVGGRVAEVAVKEGDLVQAGEPIIALEKGDLPAQRLTAEGQLEQAEAALDKLSLNSVSSARRAEIATAQARLKSEEAQRERARRDEERLGKLYRGGAGTRVEAENATIALKNADAQVVAAQAQVENLLRGTPQDIRAARGAVEVAMGRLQQVDELIAELVIRAPRRARVEVLDLRPGDILAPNSPAARLLEPDQLYLRIYVPETQLGHIRPGMKVPIFIDSFPRRAFRGRVESVASEGEFTPRNLQTADERADQVFAARVGIEQGADVLRAGMAAVIRVRR